MGGLGRRGARWLVALNVSLWSVISAAQAEQITVFAAASLKTALDQIAATFSESTEERIVVSYAGTSVLARQISLGAPADVIISASAEWMDWLEERGAIDADSRIDVVGNHLVLIAHGSEATAIPPTTEALAKQLRQDRIAMALVDAVPAGIYGKAALSHLDLWDQIAPLVAQTDNVRAALALVATGAAPYGIVYATDAMAEPRVTVLTRFPTESHAPITYPAAIVSGRGAPAAHAFLGFLQSEPARALLEQHGFQRVEAPE
ncbi:molybdate ABC transporter substrate-binding protein [Roseobacter sp. A03A-229]